MKRFMVAYDSPKYGLLMSEVETQFFVTDEDVRKVLEGEGEEPEDVQEILNYAKYIVKEVKQKPLNKYKVDKIIYEWVKRNFGENEAHDPSWSIVELANEIANKYGE